MENNGMDGFGEQNPNENNGATFQTLSAEGDLLLQRGSLHEAIDIYTKALLIRPTDKHCLVSRSKCYIQIGSPDLGLIDANASIKQDPNFFKGVYQKAEALYAQGDFESALMYYHRGHRMRPEMDEFRIGIQKSREAIENSIGHPKKFHITVPQKLKRFLNDNAATKMADDHAANLRGVKKGSKSTLDLTSPYHYEAPLNSGLQSKLLGELYDDKVYLEGLLTDRDFRDFPDDQIIDLVQDGLRYIGSRVEFWRQQNPLYARPKEKKIEPRMERGGKHS
jgi:tetratricopeptide (TPR) repeat protein